MRMLRAPGLALTAALLACAFAGCSDADGDEPAPRPTVSASPSPSASATEAAGTPVEPTLPAEAKEPTKAGARAFIAYYWDLINYAQETGEVTALRNASGAQCEGCKTGIAGIESLYDNNGYATGGQYKVTLVKINKLAPEKRALNAFEALISVTNQPQHIVNSDGSVQDLKSSTNRYVVVSLWAESRWSLEIMELQ
ncbi:hypothetical protein JK386_11385 [Nocardioides sp. zg-536]|uniref:DUF6318 domain-containing protein n=1 Tax=Nocardioides faecalis TaxID=2803858 RepID=A0A938Y791_9ACTN|nr:DUF6318 family protein [Nocardioides faecalis]MBM9460507.1 hypothetical protein [Nocardioides faecalis]QVI57558.1 hypothetical protein KG111_10685 [Nocardioides faecalis]